MAASGYHFYQRVDKHREVLGERTGEVEQAIKRAIAGRARQTTIHINPTHFHVFARVEDRERMDFVSRIREETSKLDVRWDSKHYLIPVASLSPRYVSQLLKDLHKDPLI